MSQYPPSFPTPPQVSPYSMDFNYHAPATDFLAPARRASIGMFVLAALCLLCGLWVSVASWVVPVDKMLAQTGVQLPPATNGVSPEQIFRIAITAIGVLSVLVGIVLIVIGIFVRRGGKGAAITGTVVCVILLLFSALKVVVALVMSLQNPIALVEALMTLVPTALLVMVLVWLVQTIRAAAQLSAQQQQMLAQMWQYQQQQTAYAGYNQPPIAPAPPPGSPSGPEAPKAPEAQSSTPPPNPPDAST